jgi:hypothetical protein
MTLERITVCTVGATTHVAALLQRLEHKTKTVKNFVLTPTRHLKKGTGDEDEGRRKAV